MKRHYWEFRCLGANLQLFHYCLTALKVYINSPGSPGSASFPFWKYVYDFTANQLGTEPASRPKASASPKAWTDWFTHTTACSTNYPQFLLGGGGKCVLFCFTIFAEQ